MQGSIKICKISCQNTDKKLWYLWLEAVVKELG